MIKGELNIKCATCEKKICHDGYNFCNEAMKANSFYKNKRLYKGIKPNKKLSYAELEEKISILLSCKNCPENKGGLLCQKEYEDKCLSQKIQYIKELKEEIAELKEKLEIEQNARGDWFGKAVTKDRRLTEAKELLTKWVELFKPKGSNIPPTPIQVDTEQFLKEEVK